MNRMRLLALILTFLAAIPLAAAPSKRALVSAIDAYVAPYVRHHAFSGVVLVAHGDDVLATKGYGMANYEFGVPAAPGTRFAIASITKMFTTAILTRLYEEKKLSPDDKLAKWVPDFPSAGTITIGQLAAHRSGIRDPEKLRRTIRTNMTTADTVAVLKGEPLGSVPGETYSYTTANYAVLAHVIERVTGEEFARVIQQYVYAPAKMRDSGELSTTSLVPRLATGYMPDPYGDGVAVCGPEDTSWKTGGGSSYSTASDLHRFAHAFYGGRLFAANPREVWPVAKVFDRTIGRASGAFPGANAALLHFLEEDVTVVVLSNNYAPIVPTIAQDVAAMYFGEPYEIRSVQLQPNPPAADPRIAGVYSLETRPNPFTIAIRDGRPFMSWNSARQSALIPLGANRWFIPLDWGTLTLERNADGGYEQGTMTAAWSDTALKVTRRKE
jgi:CubicO group peptidase (beta-lactamase class C family)